MTSLFNEAEADDIVNMVLARRKGNFMLAIVNGKICRVSDYEEVNRDQLAEELEKAKTHMDNLEKQIVEYDDLAKQNPQVSVAQPADTTEAQNPPAPVIS